MPLLKPRIVYKPFEYPWAYSAWENQQKMHWIPQEVELGSDVSDWQLKLSSTEKNLLTQIFRFFTQGDIEVGNCYIQHYLNMFKATEIRMMLIAFVNIETVHIAGYSYLLDTVGIPEVEYEAFLKYDEMKKKYDFMQPYENAKNNDLRHLAKTMAIFGAFVEGLQLFASFAILLNFQRFNKMKGMGQIVTWSIRDETLHSDSIIKLFHTFCYENPHVKSNNLLEEIRDECEKIIEMEDKFIDLAFGMGEIEGLESSEVKSYIRHIANLRLNQLQISPIYDTIKTNPLPWLAQLINSHEYTNFFENTPTEYTKVATQGDWSDVF